MATPIVIEVTQDTEFWPKGALLGFESEANARKALGDDAFKVLRHQDGEPYDAPKASPAKGEKKG